MSSVFYNKYKSLFFDDNDPEPLSMNYFGVRPKNSINLYPSQNIASLAQHYNILPKDLDIPRAKVEEIPSLPTKPQIYAAKLDPLPKKPALSTFETRPRQPALEYSPEPPAYLESPKRANSIQRLPPIKQESFKAVGEGKSFEEVKKSSLEVSVKQENGRVVEEVKKQRYEQTKENIFPEKVEIVRVVNPYQEAMKNRKEAKERIGERKKRLRDLLIIDKVQVL